METVFHQNPQRKLHLEHRIELLQQLANELPQHILFRDTLNFNFLYHLYSSNLEKLYNHLPNISDHEFRHSVNLLSQSIEQIKAYIIE